VQTTPTIKLDGMSSLGAIKPQNRISLFKDQANDEDDGQSISSATNLAKAD